MKIASWGMGRECISRIYKIKCNKITGKMVQELSHSWRQCNSRRALKGDWRDHCNGSYMYGVWLSGVAFLDVVSCAAVDGFLLPNSSDSYPPKSIRMKELEVG